MGRAGEHLTAIAGRLEQLTHLPSARPSGGADTGGQIVYDEPDREVLVYVGHRVHSLVSRMLERLKATEREQEDPDLLDDLYRIDHLATQLRRAAERLAVLGGHTARRAHSPVPVSTVLRQAVAEVEDYSRIQLTLPDDDPKIPGHAGPDVIPVVAELLENATKFSRPDTAVTMSTRSTPEGLDVEIRDEGSRFRRRRWRTCGGFWPTRTVSARANRSGRVRSACWWPRGWPSGTTCGSSCIPRCRGRGLQWSCRTRY